MDNGQVAGYVNFYHTAEQAMKKSVEELTSMVTQYERRVQEKNQKDVFERLKEYIS